MEPILVCKEVSKYFGDFAALNKVSFDVSQGTIFGIAGPNGAGKTTLFNVITCNPFPPSSGKIFFNGEEIQSLKPFEILHKGIARTFQIPVIFRNLSFFKSVMVGSVYGNFVNLSQNVFGYDKNKIERKALEALEFFEIEKKKDEFTIHASLFELKLLMMASALVTNPKVLFLDEPVSGLTDSEVEHMWEIIINMHKKFNVTLVIIEHIMKFLMNISNEVMVLNFGEVICRGKPSEVSSDSEVIKCYLGEEFKEIIESKQI
jgi:branched-chain amino acid transport system ATP-binding protein